MIELVSMSQRLEQFAVKNGDDAINVGGWLVFSNGAMRESNPYGVLKDPPADPFERCKIQLRYREELLRRAVRQFDELKQQLKALVEASRRNGMPPPGQPEMDRLKALHETARERQADFEQVQKELERVTPATVSGRKMFAAASQASNERVSREIDNLKL